MARRTLTDSTVDALKAKPTRYAVPDPKLPGHYVRVTPTGAKTFVAVARDPYGKQVWHTIGSAALYKIDEARERARTAIKAIRDGEDRTGPQSFAAIAEQWLKRHVEAKGLRSATDIRRTLDSHVLPAWGGRELTSIKRGDVTKLLDGIEDGAGPVAADRALSFIRSVFGWYATRHDNYANPIVKGMRRTSPKERARDRILSDDEIRAVWKQANGPFGAFVRLLLLTGQRREKVSTIRWDDITEDGTWIIRTEAREKGNADELPLPQVALDIIKAQPHFAGNPFIFARPSGLCGGRTKTEFDAKLPDMPKWRLHDLRRTARSLMSRAGIRPDVAERVLGHAIPGVGGVYDRHRYTEEKAHALRALAGLIENILQPPAENVRQLSNARAL